MPLWRRVVDERPEVARVLGSLRILPTAPCRSGPGQEAIQAAGGGAEVLDRGAQVVGGSGVRTLSLSLEKTA